jgi:DNA-binding transcriptional ArsR family regulator
MDDTLHKRLHALADPTRLRILGMLKGGRMTAGQLAQPFAMTSAAVSQHLKALKDAGLVSVTPESQKRWYALEPGALAGVRVVIKEIDDASLKAAA